MRTAVLSIGGVMTPSWVYKRLHAHAKSASEAAAGSLCDMFAGSKTLQCSAGSTAQQFSGTEQRLCVCRPVPVGNTVARHAATPLATSDHYQCRVCKYAAYMHNT
jgi:hypothetical protein